MGLAAKLSKFGSFGVTKDPGFQAYTSKVMGRVHEGNHSGGGVRNSALSGHDRRFKTTTTDF
jgi:hypothetical protein